MVNQAFEPHDVVKVGMIGLGNRGSGMARGWADVPGSQVVAVCDIRADRATRVADDLESRAARPARRSTAARAARSSRC